MVVLCIIFFVSFTQFLWSFFTDFSSVVNQYSCWVNLFFAMSIDTFSSKCLTISEIFTPQVDSGISCKLMSPGYFHFHFCARFCSMSKWKEKKKWIKIQNLHVVETLEWSSGFRTIKFLQYGDSIQVLVHLIWQQKTWY